MKVLLFVQSGDALPKCVKSFGGRAHSAMQYFARVRERLGTEGQPQKAWLVECKNAEAGRTLIYLREAISAAHRYMGSKNPEQGPAAVCGSVPTGRILASGGPRRHR